MNIATDFRQEDCPNCHIIFFVPAAFQAARIKDKQTFYCPNGHRPNYIGKTEEEKLREQVQSKQNTIFELESTIRELKRKPRKPRAKKSKA